MKGTKQQQLLMYKMERNEMNLPKIDPRSFCSQTVRVTTNLKAKLMWRQSRPNYLRFWTAKSVTMERHIIHSGRHLLVRTWRVEVGTGTEISIRVAKLFGVTTPKTVTFKSSNGLPKATIITD